jgi:hypothetical protein
MHSSFCFVNFTEFCLQVVSTCVAHPCGAAHALTGANINSAIIFWLVFATCNTGAATLQLLKTLLLVLLLLLVTILKAVSDSSSSASSTQSGLFVVDVYLCGLSSLHVL